MKQVLGRYELLHEIASGGMATVYAARACGVAGFEKLVAIKRMLPHMSADLEFQRMFLDEGRVAANIRSPYVVSTLDLDRADDGSLYIVLDFVLGCSLAELLKSCATSAEQLPAAVIAEIGHQAARGLSDAHNATSALGDPLRIVHRDISPQNVMVGQDGSIRITDFGVAHALERLTKTQGVNIKGKLAYCSPEQARGEPLDGRSDVFALGIVLWEALCVRRLFHRSTPRETVDAVLRADVMDPRIFRPEVPQPLSEVILKALAAAPEDRFESALAFAEALRNSVPHPARVDDLRALVDHHSGDAIRTLLTQIQDAANEPSEVRASLAPSGPPGPMGASSHPPPASAPPASSSPARPPQADPEATRAGRKPVAAPLDAPPASSKSKQGRVIAAIVGMLALVGVGGAALLLTGGSEPRRDPVSGLGSPVSGSAAPVSARPQASAQQAAGALANGTLSQAASLGDGAGGSMPPSSAPATEELSVVGLVLNAARHEEPAAEMPERQRRARRRSHGMRRGMRHSMRTGDDYQVGDMTPTGRTVVGRFSSGQLLTEDENGQRFAE